MPNIHSSWRTRLAVALVALVAAAGALVVSSAPSTAREPPRVLRLISTPVGPGGGGDVLPAGDSVGDSDTFSAVLSDPQSGKRVGRSESACTIFDIAEPGGHGPPVRNATFHCLGIASLKDGMLTVSGRVTFDGEGRIHARPFAVLGGTGRYSGTGGVVEEKSLSEGRSLVVIRLAP
jgi:hypothetical protein